VETLAIVLAPVLLALLTLAAVAVSIILSQGAGRCEAPFAASFAAIHVSRLIGARCGRLSQGDHG
jgi:hypothetical protein